MGGIVKKVFGSARLGSALVSIALALNVVGCGSSSDESDDAKPSQRACEQMREHLLDVRLATVSGLDAAALKAQRESLRNSLGADFVSACQQKMTRKMVQCALGASDGEALAHCDDPSVGAPKRAE